MLRLHVVASGSSGNCAIVEATDGGPVVVIDAGVSLRSFKAAMAESDIDFDRIAAVLVTHEHSDHTKGLGVVLRGCAKAGNSLPVYALPKVARASSEIGKIASAFDVRAMSVGDALEFEGVAVTPVQTSHDSVDSCGFVFSHEDDKLGYVTDTGYLPDETARELAGCRILALEANHDVRMLQEGPYPYWLKARVAGDEGHLSNDQAKYLLRQLAHEGLEHVVGMHVSRNNNTYRLARESLEQAVCELGDSCSASVSVAYQDMSVVVG